MTQTSFRLLGLVAISVVAASGLTTRAQSVDPHLIADPIDTSDRPKIALVLSGGGALGLAQVGVIRELERLGIQPDIVVGTSMGSIIGGLYASGLDGEALESAVTNLDWDAVFDVTPSREDLSYRQKTQQADFPVKLSLGLDRSGLSLPEGFVADQNLLLELRRLIPVRSAVQTFDALPIAFRAVATDIATGEKVVLAEGELALAMRASMAVPGVFGAVSLDGRLLVDGGLSANIPVDVARAMGADIVIAVATQAPLLETDEINNAVDVLAQTVSLLILTNERAQIATLGENDILIRIDPGDLTPADFKSAAAFVEAGRRSTEPALPRLRELASQRGIVMPAQIPPPRVIDFVRLDNPSVLADSVLYERIGNFAGKRADPAEIAAAMNRVYALGEFERVDYAFEDVDGQYGLVIRPQVYASGADRVRLGLTVDTDLVEGSEYSFSVDYRTGALDAFGSEVRLAATFGERNAFAADYFRLLGPSQTWFVNPRVLSEARVVDFYAPDGFRLAGYDLIYGVAGIDVGYQFGTYGEVRVGYERGAGTAELSDGVRVATRQNIDIGRIVLSGGVDTLDHPFFPARGQAAEVRLAVADEALGNSDDYVLFDFGYQAARSSGQLSFVTDIRAGSAISGVASVDALYRLGGPFSLSGYHREELAGEAFAIGRLTTLYRFPTSETGLFGVPFYIGASGELGRVWEDADDLNLAELRLGGNVFVAADTPIGPVFIALGASEGGRQTLNLFIGRPF